MWATLSQARPFYVTNTLRSLRMRFYNDLLLICADALLGLLMSCVLLAYMPLITAYLGGEQGCHKLPVLHDVANILAGGVSWLMQNPAGVKLNGELCNFLGTLFLYLLDSWEVILSRIILPVFPTMLKFVVLAGPLGLTIMLSILWDMTALLYLHVYYLYTITSRLYAIQLDILQSLWRLFTGKKRNVLRERIDSYAYDTPQLVLGTLLFTLMSFLLPTTFAFYLYFTLARVCTVVLYLLIDVPLQLLLHCPIYPFLQHHQISGGITLVLPEWDSAAVSVSSPHTWLQLVRHSAPLGAVLVHYINEAKDAALVTCKPSHLDSLYNPVALVSYFLQPPLHSWSRLLLHHAK
eukprot:TRINITY_DN12826_c0_g1_i1.p1 TRINITY_DN12826_c0_g1~~TRINITY_DN12826_c0_g1_i1.p1  ORF type:complete len:350 (+),score=24.79 TRINITY_DN12826_c0_g1_i1:143-1192(+)